MNNKELTWTTKFTQRPVLVRHVIHATAYITAILLRINDVIGCGSMASYIERDSQKLQ